MIQQSDAEPQAAREKIVRVLGRYGTAQSGRLTIANSILAALAQSDAEPVAWRYAYPDYPGHWNVTSDKLTVDERQGNADCIVEPLYTAPPRPDASAGLIEAVELFLGERMRQFTDSRAVDDDLVALAGVLAGDTDGKCLTVLRARSANRSGK